MNINLNNVKHVFYFKVKTVRICRNMAKGARNCLEHLTLKQKDDMKNVI